MAGWVDYTDTGRGAGGRGFPNRRYISDTVHGGGSSSRWRGDRSRARPSTQPHYRYRPVDAAHGHSSPSVGSEQPSASASTRQTQMSYPAAATDKSPISGSTGTVVPAGSNTEPGDKGSRNAANFECNVCFDMAAEPVVTKCGHLFCWECLYQWLHVHSDHGECPVCKGQVAQDAVIPIYGRGGSAAKVNNVPPRPTGARVESSRQQQRYPQMVFVDEEDDEEDSPFDFPSMVNFGFGGTNLRDAMRSFMSPSFDDMDIEEQYDGYSYGYIPEDFDEIYNYMGFPVFAGTEANNPNSSQMHADLIDLTDSVVPPVHHRDGYSGVHSRNRGRRGHGYRSRASADQSSTDAAVTGGSGASYRDNSANSNGSVGASSQPPFGWIERRGRSNRNSSSVGGRGMQDGRRQRSNYS